MTREKAHKLIRGVCPTCKTRYEDVYDAMRCDLSHRWPPKDPSVCGRPDCTLPAEPLHVCPYAYEIRADETLCNCCEACERECADGA